MTARPELIRERRNQAKFAAFSFPANKPMPHGILLTFEEYDYSKYIASINSEKKANTENLGFVDTIGSRADIASTSTVELPFPRTLTDSSNIRIQSFERDFLYERTASAVAGMSGGDNASTLENFAASAKSALKSIRAGSKDFFDDPVKAITDAVGSMQGMSTEKTAAIASYLARNIIGGDLARSISAASQRTVNPQETLGFTGVDLRNFSFSWDLFPSNEDDTKAIQNIVYFLKSRSLPEVEGADSNDGFLARAFLKYPDIVSLNLLGVDESKFTRFKRCMISNISVDYGAGGQVSIIKGGVPAAVTLTVSFSEVQIQTRDDFPPPPTEEVQTVVKTKTGYRGANS